MSTLQPIAPVYGTKDQPYLSRCLELPFTPIFILGEHRSGTTILYQLLANSGCFNYVHFLYIHRYDEILANHFEQRTAEAQAAFRAWLLEIGLQDRSFDRVQVTPELPEEYSFILKRFGSFWAQPRLTKKNLPLLRELCQKIVCVGAPNLPVLLKSPWDFPNARLIQQRLPNAKFVFIPRHPLEVLNSKTKAMRNILASRNSYSALLDRSYAELFNHPWQLRLARLTLPQAGGIDFWQLLAYEWWACNQFLAAEKTLPVDNQISIRYPDLCADPAAVINNVLTFLQVQPEKALTTPERLAPRPLQLLPEVAKHQKLVERVLQPYIDRWRL